MSLSRRTCDDRSEAVKRDRPLIVATQDRLALPGPRIARKEARQGRSRMTTGEHDRASVRALILGSIGVVFGDIGTSPLYALKETMAGHHPIEVAEGNVLGVLSLIFWAVTLLVSIKYVALIM